MIGLRLAQAAYSSDCSWLTALRSWSAPPNLPMISATLPCCEIGGTFSTSGSVNCEFAVGGVFFQQVVQDFAGFRGEVVEESRLLLLHAVGALAAGEHGRVEGEMAEQVKRVGVGLARLQRHLLEINAALGQVAG